MTDSNKVLDWDAAYSGESDQLKGGQPWNIGEPQPEINALIEAGEIKGAVLDVGCGHAETSLKLAALGHAVVGLDLSPIAIATATKSAAERGLSDLATYQAADATTFTGYDEQFDTVIDSALFHHIPVNLRDDYLASLYRAAKPGARLVVLTFDKEAFADVHEEVPIRAVVEPELREAVSRHWTVDEIRAVFVYSDPGSLALPAGTTDERGRMKSKGWLLLAHKA